MENKNIRREWVVQGRYDYYAVDEFHPDEPGNATYGTVDTFKSRKQAERVALALNLAFRYGTEYSKD